MSYLPEKNQAYSGLESITRKVYSLLSEAGYYTEEAIVFSSRSMERADFERCFLPIIRQYPQYGIGPITPEVEIGHRVVMSDPPCERILTELKVQIVESIFEDLPVYVRDWRFMLDENDGGLDVLTFRVIVMPRGNTSGGILMPQIPDTDTHVLFYD